MFAEYDCAGNKIALTDEMLEDGTVTAPADLKYDQLIGFEGKGVKEGDQVVLEVRIKNADGSMARNCLNGMRALGDFFHTQRHVRNRIKMVQNGLLLAHSSLAGEIPGVEVDLPRAYDTELEDGPDFVDVGNEHLVYHVKSADSIPRSADYVPDVANEEFVFGVNLKRAQANVVVFEKGVGLTGSCGTGSVAVFSSLIKRGYDQRVLAERFRADLIQPGKFPAGELHLATQDGRVTVFGSTVLKRIIQDGVSVGFSRHEFLTR